MAKYNVGLQSSQKIQAPKGGSTSKGAVIKRGNDLRVK
jgi:hypothetical protein